MKHEVKVRYPAPASTVIGLFTDASFYPRKLEALGVPRFKVLEAKEGKNDLTIKLELHVPMQVPGMLKKVVPSEMTVVQEESWDRATRTGTLRVHSAASPADMSCKASIAEDGKACVVTYAWEVKARIPLIGGTLEKFICSDIDDRAKREQAGVDQLVKGAK
jgi:hypothetical protein